MAGDDLGAVSVDIVPDASGFDAKLRAATVPIAVKVGREIAKALAAPLAAAITGAIRDGLKSTTIIAEATRSGRGCGKAFATAFKAETKGLKVTVGLNVDTKQLTALKAQLNAVSAKALKIKVDPDATGFESKLVAMTVPAATKVGLAISKAISAPINNAVSGAIRDGLTSAGNVLQAAGSGKAAGRAWKQAFNQATQGISVSAGVTVNAGDLGALQAQLALLVDRTVHIDTVVSSAQLTTLLARLGRLNDRTITITTNTVGGVPSLGPGGGGAGGGGDDPRGAFATAVQQRLSAASRSIQRPVIGLGLNASEFDRGMGRVRTELSELARQRVGIDVSVDEALGRMVALQARVTALRAMNPSIQVQVDTAQALAEIQAIHDMISREMGAPAGRDVGGAFGRSFQETIRASLADLPNIDLHANNGQVNVVLQGIRSELSDLSGRHIGVDLDAAAAMAQLENMRVRLSSLARETPDIQIRTDTLSAMARIEALQAQLNHLHGDVDIDTGGAIAQIAALTAAAVMAQVGLGMLGFAGMSMAMILVPAAAACVVGIGAIAAGAVAAGAAIGVLMLGMFGVISAVKAMGQAEGKAGTSAATLAGRQVALANSADQLASAQDSLRSAHDSLRTAQERALVAQQQLTQARVDARLADEDLSSQIANGALAQRRANFDLADAKKAYEQSIVTGSLATEDDRAKAKLAYDEAKQQIDDLATRQNRLIDQQKEARRVGIEGSKPVVEAKDGIKQADQQVAQAKQGIVQAKRGVASAQRGAGQAGLVADGGSGGGVDKVADAMGKLSPAGQSFALFLYSLKPIFEQLARVAQEGFLPGLQAGMKALLPVMPQITAAVGAISTVMGELFASAGKALASPFWQNFFQTMTDLAVPILRQMGPTIGNLAKGFAALLLAFAPLAPVIGQVLLTLSQRFADFATGLTTNPGFQKFVDYAVANAPMLVDLLSNLAIIVIKLLIAFAPFGAIMLRAALALAEWLASLDPSVLATIAGVITAIIGVCMGSAVIVGAALAIIVAAIVYAWTHFETFRNVVMAVWNGIVAASVWAWNTVLKPTFRALADFFTNVLVPAAVWLWQNVLVPMWTAIAAGAVWAWNTVLKPTLNALVSFFNDFLKPAALYLWNEVLVPMWGAIVNAITIAWSFIKPVLDWLWMAFKEYLIPVCMWFWHNVIEPMWTAIGIAINVSWAIIQVVFGLIMIAIKILAAVFMWLWHTAIEPVWNGIASAIGWVWDNILKPIFKALGNIIKEDVAPAFKAGVEAIGKAWDTIKDIAKIPIKFIVDTVLNNGLIGGYNTLARLFNVHEVAPIKLDGFATGGLIRGAGSGTSDSILARVAGGPHIRVSNGEYIVPAATVQAYGVGFFDHLSGRRKPRRPGDGSEGLAFKDGGLLDFGSDLWDFVTDPIGKIKKPLNAAIDRIPGGPFARDVVGGSTRRIVDGMIGWVKNFGGSDSNVSKTQAWLRAQNGKPYVWAAAGPDGYDCSGLVSAAYLMMHGKNPYSHIFSTSNEAPFFPKAGRGVFSAGWSNAGERGGGDVGHTAGNLAGLGFESTGPGVRIGNSAVSLDSFTHIGHFDSGGYLPPGLTLAYNGTGKMERIRTAEQEADLARRSGGDEIHFHAPAGIAEVQAFLDRRDTLARVGRPS
jgi:hypothetical protein